MLITMKYSIHEEHLSQPRQTNNKHFKIAPTFLTGYNGFLMLQTKTINSISQNHLLIEMVMFNLLFH